ncbi:APC family permease [Longimicrobium sp.]|uniref:APC family permease n=1 Tax=Longimicrobium sp. TaxID=2029185 RepID=UPI003B3BB062
MANPTPAAPAQPDAPQLARRLGLFDATMIVMGGIVGSGIFVTPSVVARHVNTPALIVGVWLAGGLIALAGAFVYAELAARRPHVGGQYAYLRDAYHPAVAFVYGWALLLVIQTGGMAAVAVTFARYFREVTQVPLAEPVVAGMGIALLVAVNCLGVRSGGTVQNALMVLKIVAIVALVGAGLAFSTPWKDFVPAPAPPEGSLLLAFGAAMTPVMFSYGGWQTASFVAGEMRNPRRDLARGLLIGVLGVIALYVGVTLACIHALGASGLAQTTAPASSVMRLAFGDVGATLIAAGIAISTLGFLSQGMLTAPRVYFAMAADGVFFRQVAWVSPRTQAPVVAVVLQGALSLLIALTGSYEQILSYVVAVDWVFFGLTAGAIFLFRRRGGAADDGAARVPGHPLTTALFITAAALIVISTVLAAPVDSAIGLGIMLTGVPIYLIWRRRAA